jgi:hypothetical protein
MMVLLLLATVICASSVPPVDDPETAINEADLQISLAPPVTTLKVAAPAASSVHLSKLVPCRPAWGVNSSVDGLTPVATQSSRRSLQKLLCTFLI